MGEYVIYRNQEIKIGTCEELMYVSFEKYLAALRQGLVTEAQYSAAPLLYVLPSSQSLYRLPYPDELFLPLGDVGDLPIRRIEQLVSAALYEAITGYNVKGPQSIYLEYQKLFIDETQNRFVLGLVVGSQHGLYRIGNHALVRELLNDILQNRAGGHCEDNFLQQLMAKVLAGYHENIFQVGATNAKHLLVDRPVAVHPDLTTDPYDSRGQVGNVLAVQPDHRSPPHAVDIMVNFSDRKLGLYDADALLTLSPRSVIIQGLMSNAGELSKDERQAIIQILKLVQRGKQTEALTAALKSATSQFFCTTTCTDFMEMITSKKQQQQKGLRRK